MPEMKRRKEEASGVGGGVVVEAVVSACGLGGGVVVVAGTNGTVGRWM